MPTDEILTIREVAALLKVGEKTVYTMAQTGDLPAFKVRGQWRFRRVDLDVWIRDQVEQSRAARDEPSLREVEAKVGCAIPARER